MKKPVFILSLASLWFIITVVLLTLPGSDMPQEKWLNIPYLDKLVHIGIFAVLVFLWCWVAVKKDKRPQEQKSTFLKIALLAIVYGIMMEFVQRYFIPGRSFDVLDMLADAFGALMGFSFSTWRFIKK